MRGSNACCRYWNRGFAKTTFSNDSFQPSLPLFRSDRARAGPSQSPRSRGESRCAFGSEGACVSSGPCVRAGFSGQEAWVGSTAAHTRRTISRRCVRLLVAIDAVHRSPASTAIAEVRGISRLVRGSTIAVIGAVSHPLRASAVAVVCPIALSS
jgi:hypothetical protein